MGYKPWWLAMRPERELHLLLSIVLNLNSIQQMQWFRYRRQTQEVDRLQNERWDRMAPSLGGTCSRQPLPLPTK